MLSAMRKSTATSPDHKIPQTSFVRIETISLPDTTAAGTENVSFSAEIAIDTATRAT